MARFGWCTSPDAVVPKGARRVFNPAAATMARFGWCTSPDAVVPKGARRVLLLGVLMRHSWLDMAC